MVPHQLDRAQARRIAVRAQLLAAPRPTDLLTVVRQHAVHEDVPFTPELTRAVHDELRDLASWLTLTAEGLR
ncbi:hypothetical protein OOJ91_30370 [Micromonospora lupini]|uniref:hypothetical protein n=1 Tax=Micromonospora lupini TaxID=285679 RepID=UPI00225C2032|nr:hypothetical protein [Micromonospora lupini]MCX5070160.1 hypothetical protein [Micromonospora lupini]